MPPSSAQSSPARVLCSLGSGILTNDAAYSVSSFVVTPSPKASSCREDREYFASPDAKLSAESEEKEATVSETEEEEGLCTADPPGPSLGGEPPLLDVAVEQQGVQGLWNALADAEKAQIMDYTTCIRFLRAHKGNTKAALAGIRHTLQWRSAFGVNQILQSTHREEGHSSIEETRDAPSLDELAQILRLENETGKTYVRGFDAEGRAFLYMRPVCENTKHETNNMRHLVWNLEKAIAVTRLQSRRLGGKELTKVNLLIDYEGFQLKDAPPLSTSRYTLDILQKHYPESMYRAYCLNPPFVFKTFWMIVRPFVDQTTKRKIVFCNSGTKSMGQLHDACGRDRYQQILEPAAEGKATRPFDTHEYMRLPFSTSFDELETL